MTLHFFALLRSVFELSRFFSALLFLSTYTQPKDIYTAAIYIHICIYMSYIAAIYIYLYIYMYVQ